MQQVHQFDSEHYSELAIAPSTDSVGRRSMPRGRLRHLMAIAQDGDRHAYRQFLTEACRHLENFYRGMLVHSERERIIEMTVLSIHEKLGTCDTTESVRPWIEALAEYRRKQANQHLILSGHLIQLDD